MDELDKLLECYREPLLERLNAIELRSHDAGNSGVDPRRFIATLLEEWERLPRNVRRSPIRPGESAFWNALYTMENLLEITASEKLGPFEDMLLENLAQARQWLESRAELPHGRFASRPDGR
jgi:hypothetical protein